jgi:hypothetical protein
MKAQLDKIKVAFSKVAQPRSDYAIERFVVGEHETQERQYAQCVTELWRKATSIRRAEIELAKKEREISSCSDDLDQELLALDMEEIRFAIAGAQAEFQTLFRIFESLPDFTAEELQAGEERYWTLRLARQAQIDIEATGRVGVGNLDALRQAGMTPDFAATFLANNKHQLENLNVPLPLPTSK